VRVVDHIVEQRFSNLAQGVLTLATMTGPLLVVLHLIPQAVLAGLFFVMGIQALVGNGITQKMLFLARDKTLTHGSDPLARLERKSAVWIFVLIELIGFAATFAITQSIAAIGFPVFIIILIPVRSFLLPKWFRPEELRALDAPTAGAFVMESVGGAYGEDANSNSNGESGFDSANGIGTQQSRTSSDLESVIDDTMERGEVYELRTQSGSHSQMQLPEAEMERRSRSTSGRGTT
jgi:boron transporter